MTEHDAPTSCADRSRFSTALRAVAVGTAIGGVLVVLAYLAVFQREVVDFAASGGSHWWHERRGRCDALADVRAGRLVLKTYGLQLVTDCDPVESRVFQRLYGLRYEMAAGCVVEERVADYVAGYNGVVVNTLVARYGRDWDDRALRQARAECEAALLGHSSPTSFSRTDLGEVGPAVP